MFDFLGFWVLANLPTVHRGDLAGGGSVAVAVGVSDGLVADPP